MVLGGGQEGAFATIFDGVSVNTNRQAVTTESNLLTPSVEAITQVSKWTPTVTRRSSGRRAAA